MNDLVAILSAFTALCAVILAPLVSMHVTRRQIEASVLSKNRQEWINTLRDELVELIVALRGLQTVMILPQEHRSANELKGLIEKITRREIKITLLINPKETDHAELIQLISDGLLLAASASDHPKERIIEVERKIATLSQRILKREWQRVKAIQ